MDKKFQYNKATDEKEVISLIPSRAKRKILPMLQQAEDQREKLCKVIIELSGRETDQIDSLVQTYNGKIYRKLGVVPSIVVELPYNSLPELAKLRQVKKVWYDAQVKSLLNTAAPTVCGFGVKKTGFNGKNVTVAVLDTGVYPHRDLTYPANRIIAWVDFVNHKRFPYDDNGHGTHVAGIIAGNGSSSRGIYTGMAPGANLVALKVLDKDGNGSLSAIIEGIDWCINNKSLYNIRVINLSFGAIAQDPSRYDLLCRATTAAWKNGIVVCTAAGNNGPEPGTINTPGINPKIITVGNLDHRQTITGDDDRLNPTSSRGPTLERIKKPDLLAPGTGIISLKVGGGYRQLTGTSMATSMVSGGVALLLEKQPSLRPEQVKKIFFKNTRSIDLGANSQGTGILDLNKVLIDSRKSSRGRNPELKTLSDYEVMASSVPNQSNNHIGLNFFNPYFLFLILILLILGCSWTVYGGNPYFLFLILILLICSFAPGSVNQLLY